jgi:hypothetical protein
MLGGELYQMKEKSRGKLRYFIPIFCTVLILASYVSYSFGYKLVVDAAFDEGYSLGYDSGYFNGNMTGYELGYVKGVIERA